MRTHRRAAAFIFVTLLLTPVSGAVPQDRGGVPTETQDRLASKFDPGILWNALGLLGLFGLLGLRKGHEEDSYHPTAFE